MGCCQVVGCCCYWCWCWWCWRLEWVGQRGVAFSWSTVWGGDQCREVWKVGAGGDVQRHLHPQPSNVWSSSHTHSLTLTHVHSPPTPHPPPPLTHTNTHTPLGGICTWPTAQTPLGATPAGAPSPPAPPIPHPGHTHSPAALLSHPPSLSHARLGFVWTIGGGEGHFLAMLWRRMERKWHECSFVKRGRCGRVSIGGGWIRGSVLRD